MLFQNNVQGIIQLNTTVPQFSQNHIEHNSSFILFHGQILYFVKANQEYLIPLCVCMHARVCTRDPQSSLVRISYGNTPRIPPTETPEADAHSHTITYKKWCRLP